MTIPYAPALVAKIPPVAVRLRRDVGSLLALIRSHAVLHQATRNLVADIMAEGVGATVSETVRQTVEAVAAIAPLDGIELRPLADKLQLDKSNVSRRLRHAADGGYVRNLEDKRGKPGRWIIGDPLPEAADLLPDPAQLRNTSQPPDQDRCGVAPGSDGERADHAGAGAGQMSVCAACGQPMYVIEDGQTTHPMCEARPT